MKKILLILLMITCVVKSQAQMQQTVSIGGSYPNAVYYSMQNGAYPSVDNTNWDLGFQIRGFWASIIINSKSNVQAWRANKSLTQWASMTASDTTGILNSAYELRNSDLSWDNGALSYTYDTSNAFDLGWGVYDFVTHAVNGDSLFFIKLSNGNYKKLMIESLVSGIYNFRWADLDGTNEVIATLDKANFPNKFFGYYSIVNNNWIDREPADYNQWDLLFTQYLAVTPIVYKVTGVLSNDSVFVEKAYPVDVNTVQNDPAAFSSDINKIGYDWKAYDFVNNVWTIEDSLVYFVKDRNAGLWKVIFTGFGGVANGNYDFTKEFLGVASVADPSYSPFLTVYPNPASDKINFVVAAKGDAQFRIYNSMGEIVKVLNTDLYSELNTLSIDLNGLSNGLYLLATEQNGKRYTKPFVIH